MDSLFALPFFAGLPLALALPMVGLFLRLRDEWLATLGLAHLAGAGALAGMAAAWPPIAGALVGAIGGGALKFAFGGLRNSSYGLMILAGWAATLLVAANTALGEALAHALVDGQLFFAGGREAAVAAACLVFGLPVLRWLAPRLVAARLFPERERANRLPAWRWHLGFDLLAAALIAAGAVTVGLMATFALVFVPPWFAFRRAPNWRRAQGWAAGLGAMSYGLAFALALILDQPFGPVVVAVLVLFFALCALTRRPVSADLARR